MYSARRRPLVASLVIVAACGAPASPSATTGAGAGAAHGAQASSASPSGLGTAPARSTPTSTSTAPPAPGAPRPSDATIYARLQPDLQRCYEQGKRSTPEMLDGRLTLNASVDASGHPSCVIVSEDTGLTQEVEDCMAARLSAERFDAGPPWMDLAVTVVLRQGALQLGERTASQLLGDTVEARNMPDAFVVIESLLPALQTCTRTLDRRASARSLLVAARVGPDGRTQCALTSSTTALPPEVSECASGVLREAKFPPPKRGAGVVIVPINLPRTK